MSKKKTASALNKIISPIIFELSMRNLRLNFLLSMLSMICIIIGVLAITSLGMMGAAFSTDMTSLLASVIINELADDHIKRGENGGRHLRNRSLLQGYARH